MYNNADTHTGSAVARDTKDRSVRLHLPSTVKSQLERKHHKMTIGTSGHCLTDNYQQTVEAHSTNSNGTHQVQY